MFISVFAVTVFILLAAMIMDFGLFYYKQARLQNAGDAAATAVASSIDATDKDMYAIAKQYLKKNGVDYSDEDMKIKIEKKGMLDEATANDDDYITTGYIKMTVKIKTGTLFGPILNIDSLMLHSTSFVKVSANYAEGMPRALNYTLFAGSSNGTNANPAIKINGRTGTVTNIVSSGFETVINGINEKLVQPIKGFFGGTPNYTDLVHINLSEAITNGDIHSNSNMNIGVQVVNASRVKDGNLQDVKTDSDGNPVAARDDNGNIIYQKDSDGNFIYRNKTDSSGNPIIKKDSNGNIIYSSTPKTDDNGNPVYKVDENGNYIPKKDSNGNPLRDENGNVIYEQEYEPEYEIEKVPVYVYENYTQSTSDENSANDYGQVTYTAVKDINFTNTSWNPNSVHLYVQNQQKIETTQTALAILNMIDYSKVSSLASLQREYETTANDFFEAKGSVITDAQKTKILAQKNNLVLNGNTITLANQESIVYDINRNDSRAMLEKAYEDSHTSSSSTEVNGITIEKSKLFDQISNGEDKLYSNETTKTLLFQNIADTLDRGGAGYQIEVGKGNNKYTVVVTGDKVNRDYAKTGSDTVGSDYNGSVTAVGAKYAMYKTFQQRLGDNGFITTPNFKPYFIRMTNKSVANSVKKRGDYTSAEAKVTVRKAVADLGTQLQDILDDTSYEDKTYSDFNNVIKKDTSPFFTQNMASKSSGLTKLEGDDHTKFNGYSLYNSKDVLKTPSEFVNEYKKSYKFADVANKNYYDKEISGKYADDGVQAKKKTIKAENVSVSEKYNSVKDDATYKRLSSQALPNKKDVFLGDSSSYTKRTEFEEYVNSAYSVKPDMETATSLTKPDSFNINDYMPTFDYNNHTVTANGGITFGNGSARLENFQVTGSRNEQYLVAKGKNKWLTNGFERGDWTRIAERNGSFAVIIGDANQKSGNMDVGYNYTGCTLVVDGNLNVNDTLQIRKNCVVIVTGSLTCGSLYMENGARLYVKGNITANNMSYNGDSNQKIYCGGNATLPNNLDSTREYKIGGNLDSHDLSLTYSNYYFGGAVKCTKFNAEYNDMNLVLESFECSGTTTLNNRTALNVNGSVKTDAVNMYNGSVISVCGSMSSTGEQNLFQNSKIIVNGVASLGTLKLHDESRFYALGGAQFAGDISADNNSLVNVNNAIICNNAVWLGGTAKIYANSSFTAQRLTGSTANNIIQANGIKFTQTSNKDRQFSVHCRLESWGDIEFNCYVCIENDCVAVAKGKVIANGIYKDNGETGLDIEGVVYSVEDVITAYPLKLNSGKLYCTGDVKAATTNSGGYYEALQIKGTSELYVTGVVTSGAGRRFKLYSDNGGQGSTVSIFGLYGTNESGYINALSSNINEFTNEQPNSRIYLGDGTLEQTATNSYLSFSKQFINAGSLYLYGSLSISNNNFVGNNGGSTIIGGNLVTSSGAISLSNSHTLIVFGYLASNGAINVNSSRIYVGKYLSINATGASVTLNDNSYMIIDEGKIENACNSISINNGSKFWSLATIRTTNVVIIESSSADNLSEFFANGRHKISQTDTSTTASMRMDVVINGLYIAENSDDKILNSLYIKQYGKITHNGSLTVLSSLKVDDGGYLYVKESVSLGYTTFLGTRYSAKLSNGGKMYLMGGLDIVNSAGSENDPEIAFTSDKADTFIAANSSKSLTLKGYLFTRGIVNIENSVTVNGNERVDGMPNRGVSLAVLSGSANISGNVSLSDGNALFVKSGSLGIGGDVNMACVVYNYGKLYILGNLNVNWNKTKYISDRGGDGNDMRTGYSLKNGQTIGTVDAYLYIGGTNDLKFYGYVQNFGEIYSNAGMRVRGWCNMPSNAIMCDTAFINFKNAKAHFGGSVDLNSNAFYNGENSVFDCGGDYTYGIVTINLGSFAASGNVEMNKINVDQSSHNNASWRNSKSFSFMNGIEKVDGVEFKNATVYVGGNLKLGSNQTAGVAGSYITMGKTYIGGDLLDYCNRANAYYATAIWAFNFSNTFIGGDCFGGAGIATGNNSIFMVGGDYQSRRSTKINIEMFSYSAIDATFYSFCDDNRSYRNEFNKDPNKYRSAYFYVGGNMLCNTVGASLWTSSASKVPENNSRDTDIYSNSNVYVGGSMYVNSKLYMKQNVTLAVAGKKKLNDTSTLRGILDAIEDGTIKANIQNLLNNDDYKLFVFQCLDENICSKIITNGSMLVRDTAKMRDMTKNYIAGNFKGNDYVEIGKSLLDDDEDRSQAAVADGNFWTKGDSLKTYTFKNAGYTYVGGNFESGKYTKLYASTTLRVKDDYVSNKYLTLRHDAKIYVGKKLKALTSIEGGSYSEFHVGGSLQASTSWIKLRDCTTVAVGGNFTALSYIELGKYGDYVRTINGNKVTEQTAHGVTEGEEAKYDTGTDSGDGSSSEGDKTGGSKDAGQDGNIGNSETNVTNDSLNAQKELEEDKSDLAKGGNFFIGQSLVSYTGQIFEYAYSQVAVGNFVFTPKYLTLRHNADMWVMPETFKNATYMHKPYVSGSDGSLWGNIVDALKKFNYIIKDTFSAKQGSIYTLGSLTLNKNASLMGTYDCLVQGQCVFRQDALVYLGHDFTCTANSFNLNISSIKGDTSYAGFDSRGTSSQDGQTSFPVLLYADNNINIFTTIDIRLTYLIANKGDVNLFNVYSNTENAAYNAKQLPNAICSYQGDINYFAGYGKLGALFYAPNGNLDFDGWYQEIWGCGIANTIEDNAYYFNLHRFENWRTMDLHLAESGSIFLVSEDEYNRASDDVFNYDLDDSNTDMASGGSSVFFPRDVLDNIPGENY